MSLQGKVALVTGASRGIGQAIALELGRQGAIVVGTATSASGAERSYRIEGAVKIGDLIAATVPAIRSDVLASPGGPHTYGSGRSGPRQRRLSA